MHFEAVDYFTKVWVNGQFVGEHRGGFVPFSFDITNHLQPGPANRVVVRVEDRTLTSQPLGKQSWKADNFLCWYSRTTGIWQPVWLEWVPLMTISFYTFTEEVYAQALREIRARQATP